MKSTLIFLLLLVISACEGNRVAKGIVKNKATDLPLDSVLCVVTNGIDSVLTDTSGRFFLDGPFGGCGPKCPDIDIEFSKQGFKTLSVTNPDADAVIFLEK